MRKELGMFIEEMNRVLELSSSSNHGDGDGDDGDGGDGDYGGYSQR